MIENLLHIGVKAIFVENMIFAYFLGMCSYLAVSKKIKTAVGLGLAVTFVLAVTIPLNYWIYEYMLKDGAMAWLSADLAGFDFSFLSIVVFIAVIAAFVQLLEMAIEKMSPSLYNALGIFLPLIAVNCSILGGALFLPGKEFANVGEATAYGLGSGIGWLLAVVALAAIREGLSNSNVPKPLRGLGITFIVVGLMAMGFMSFMGFKIPF